MAKTKISEFSATPGNNTDIDGINIAEGCAPSGINDAIRELMSQLKDWQSGASNDPMTIGSSGSLTLSYGTANGVAYLNGSKVLTTGSALTFDGTNFSTTGSSTATAFIPSGSSAPTNGMYLGSANNLTWSINSTRTMDLTSTGLGIGTSSPGSKVSALIDASGGADLYSAENSNSGANTTKFAGLKFRGRDTVNTGKDAGYIRVYPADQDYVGSVMSFWTRGSDSVSSKMSLDGSGNLGLGVTPSAWGSGYTPIQGAGYSLYSGNTVQMRLSANEYFSSTASTYRVNGAAALYQQNAGVHSWHYAASGTANTQITFTQAMTLDASGNLVLGDTSASHRLTVVDNSTGTQARLRSSSSGGTSLSFVNTATNGRSWRIGSNFVTGNGEFAFYDDTAGAERARIDSSGNLLVGMTTYSTATNGIAISAVGTETTNTPRLSISGADSTNTYTAFSIYSTGAAANRFYVGYGGTVYATNTTITAISDQRLKENIRDLDDGLVAVMALKPRKFDWKAGKGKDKKGDRGWIAQELEQVFPDMVTTWLDPAPEGEEPYKAVNADLIPVLVKALQEQQSIIETLTARVAALESK